MKITKWYTTAEYVDIDTGEIISKKVALKDYYKTNITKKTEINENYGIRKYIHECRAIGQTRLEI